MSEYRLLPQPQNLIEALDTINKIQEHLARSPERLGADPPGSDSIMTTALGKVRLVRPIPSSKAGLEVPPAGDLVAVAGSSLVPDTRVVLRGPWTALGPDDVILLLSNGMKLVEVARSGGSGTYLACPVYIAAGGTVYWSMDCAAEEMYVKGDIVPYYDHGTDQAMQTCGTSYDPFKQVFTWNVWTRWTVVESSNYNLGSGQIDDWDPTGGDITQRYQIWRVQATGPATITGIQPFSIDGVVFDFINVGSNTITFANENGGSTAAYRILTGSGLPVNVGQNDTSRLWYDKVSSRWRVLK